LATQPTFELLEKFAVADVVDRGLMLVTVMGVSVPVGPFASMPAPLQHWITRVFSVVAVRLKLVMSIASEVTGPAALALTLAAPTPTPPFGGKTDCAKLAHKAHSESSETLRIRMVDKPRDVLFGENDYGLDGAAGLAGSSGGLGAGGITLLTDPSCATEQSLGAKPAAEHSSETTALVWSWMSWFRVVSSSFCRPSMRALSCAFWSARLLTWSFNWLMDGSVFTRAAPGGSCL
jgi:hypothetical protein